MKNLDEVVFVGAARTPISSFGGALKDCSTVELASTAVKEAIARAGLSASQVGQIVLGHVIPTETRDMYLSRVVGLQSGLDKSSVAMNVNRLCGSGLQAIVSAANAIQLGECDVAVGGGVESMSRGLYAVPGARWGQRMGDASMVDLMLGAVTDPFGAGHMGITAENVAREFSITRAEQDAFALESQKRALAAIAAGHFKSQIVAVNVSTRKGVSVFDTDDYPRADVTAESLAKMKPAFQKNQGTVTAGNASGINDGAAACVLMAASSADRAGITPLGRLVSYAVAGVDPNLMGTGPIPAVQLALQRAGLKLDDIDVIESNEAFAVQSLAVCRGLGIDPARTNVNGGAVALGHPLGATGAILTIKCLYELKRMQKRYGLVTMCIGGGQGIAAIIARQ